MTVAVVEILMRRQTGKSTLAASMVRGAVAYGREALYVAPTQDMARDATRRLGMPLARATWPQRLESYLSGQPVFSLVVLDDAEMLDPEVFRYVYDRLSAFDGPAQMVVFSEGETADWRQL